MMNPQAKESMDVKVQDQNNVDLSFSTSSVSSALNLYSKGLLLIRQYVDVLERLIDAVRHKPGEYVDVLQRLIDAERHKPRELWRENILRFLCQFLARKGISALDNLPF
jgi:hypothetical protein